MNALIVALQEQRDTKQTELDELLKAPTEEKRNLTEDEDKTFDEIRTELTELDERIDQLVETEKRKTEAAEERKKLGLTAVVNEPNPVYRRDDSAGPSFFRDLALLNKPSSAGFEEARARLVASQESRAGDMTTVAGAGGRLFAAAAA